VPIELTGGESFPPAGDLPYMLTLPAYGFFWFLLADEAEAPRWRLQTPTPLPEYVTVTAPGGSLKRALADDSERRLLERYALPAFMAGQRWFADKAEKITRVAIQPIGALPGDENQLLIVEAETGKGEAQRYLMPLSVLWGEDNLRFGAPKLSWTLAKIRTAAKLGAIIDASYDERFHRDLIAAIRAGRTIEATGGTIHVTSTPGITEVDLDGPLRSVGVEQSNVSFIANDQAIVKIYRRLRDGEQPEIAVSRFLTEVAGFRNTPPFLGAVEFVPTGGEPVALAAVSGFVRNQGDAWNVLLDALSVDLDAYALTPPSEEPPPPFAHPLNLGTILGQRTAELHAAFAIRTADRSFKAEATKAGDLKRWVREATRDVTRAVDVVQRALPQLSDETRADATALVKARKQILARLAGVAKLAASGLKTRVHGDYHLGQVLVAQDDVYLIDFEGEPQRGLAERRAKTSPLRDVAGMLRSFDYAARSALDRQRERAGTVEPPLHDRIIAWRDQAIRDFLGGYAATAEPVGFLPEGDLRAALLDLFVIQKAAYEVQYEASARPTWLAIPIRGMLDIMTRDMG